MQFTIPPVRMAPADLWTAGVDLTASELSGLLEECTFHTVESTTDADGDPAFYVIDPCGERLDDGYPFPCLDSLIDFVGWRIDEALADAGLPAADSPDDF